MVDLKRVGLPRSVDERSTVISARQTAYFRVSSDFHRIHSLSFSLVNFTSDGQTCSSALRTWDIGAPAGVFS
jgi:hypothetical protein